jgi:ribosomal protein S6--L-glutamate ligase
VGGTPVIIKLLEGTQGIGVILAENPKTAEAIIETLQSTKQNVLIQKFVAESKGRDIRAFVVGDRVVCAMRRQATGQEFRSNVHRGGSVQVVQLDEHYERTAVRAAQIIGLQVAGVDMLEGKDGPQIMEVNSSPGLQGIEQATKVDVAGAIIEHLEDRVDFEEIDIRQRLTLARGFQIAEITVGHDSEIAYKTLVETGFRARDILVLSINRNTLIIPNPEGEFKVLPGDLLLCYGKQIAIKSFLLAGAKQD